MGDLFDEFMRELERRRAEAEGRTPRDPVDPEAPAGDDDRPGTEVPPDDSTVDQPAGDTPDEGTTAATAGTPDPPPTRPRAKGAAADDRPTRHVRSSPWAVLMTAPDA